MHSPTQLLTREEKQEIFRIATRSFFHWYGVEFADGFTDVELAAKLEAALGIFGGSGGPDQLSVTYKGAGLKIWGGRSVVNHVTTAPLFQGKETIMMAREVYQIVDPNNEQLQLI